MVGVKATEVSGFFGGGTAFGKCAVGVAAGEGMGFFGGVCGCHFVWLGGCGVGDVECGGYLEGRSVGLEEMLSVRGKKVGRKWEEKWEVLVSGKWWWWCLWLCSSVCVSTFMQCCDCLTCSGGVTSAACPDCLTG